MSRPANRAVSGPLSGPLSGPVLAPGERLPTSAGPLVLRLWIPLTPLLVLLSPAAMLAAPLARRQARARGMNPWAAAWALGAVLLSLSGTSVDVETRAARIHLRIF